MKGHNYGLCRKCGKTHKHPMEGKHHTPESKQKSSLSHLGQTSWNKGLTKETNESVRQISIKAGRYKRTDAHKVAHSEYMKNWHKHHKHPRKGKHLTDEVKEKIRRTVKETMKDEKLKEKCRAGRLSQIFPKKGTYIENTMQNELIKRGIDYKNQVTILGKYQVDFLIHTLIVECDGAYWHNYPYGLEKDHRRDDELKERGFTILRFWGKDIKNNISKCVDKIKETLTCIYA